MLRREFLTGLIALAGGNTAMASTPHDKKDEVFGPPLGEGTPFSRQNVVDLARKLAGKSYALPPSVPQQWLDISYDDYVSIWFNGKHAVWNSEENTPLRLDMFAPGLYFKYPIQIAVVEDGQAREVMFDLGVFDKTDKFPDLPIDDTLGYSGLRLRAELEKEGIYQEFAVFQGASYFRAIGTGQIYGLSARGLAIDTAEPTGEEFPDFRAFWVEKPVQGSETYRVHALLDSPSCTGAYQFDITHGDPLVMEIKATVFARSDCQHVGLAPLTSMFFFDETNRDRFSDFRPAVHDSDGLLITNGAGETLWRPLANPRNLQVSAFQDTNPKGFGLMQRARQFGDFADLQAHYHRRPGVWIEPHEDWGEGAVTLVEIPTELEIYDNIVCYWRPAGGLPEGSETEFSYRLTWAEESDYGQGLTVLNTRIGDAFRGKGIIVAVDFAPGADVPEDLDDIEKVIWASNVDVSEGVLQRNPETGGPRLAFKFHPGEAQVIELRAELRVDGQPLSETWLYRWTA
ncbi:glucan biosynthesis protein [Shimia abyssi]|uniref:Glucans biosynthesis protein n=1 Tax=Shimia abyssi TaxID=1662395 RepID=A0A2P8FBG2_9RHOB|nr:glucan biosynthesis protein G [Shimia abyssi]PSL19066.1 glucans biosynthesis protein [Shimia abyssi]